MEQEKVFGETPVAANDPHTETKTHWVRPMRSEQQVQDDRAEDGMKQEEEGQTCL